MPPIVCAIEVDREPHAVFGYATDPSRFCEWQQGVVEGCAEGAGTCVGATCRTTRRIGLGEQASTSRIIAVEPPERWAIRGVDGPIRADVEVRVEPLDGGARSRLTIALDFEGHGIGKVLVPLVVRRQARAEMPANLERLKQRLERGA